MKLKKVFRKADHDNNVIREEIYEYTWIEEIMFRFMTMMVITTNIAFGYLLWEEDE